MATGKVLQYMGLNLQAGTTPIPSVTSAFARSYLVLSPNLALGVQRHLLTQVNVLLLEPFLNKVTFGTGNIKNIKNFLLQQHLFWGLFLEAADFLGSASSKLRLDCCGKIFHGIC